MDMNSVRDLRPFLPAEDFALAKQFYFMMHLMVADADVWWTHIHDKKIVEKYPDIMAKPPAIQPWGLRVLYLSDPSGVLWHIADDRKT